jgi:hypothetical protein
VVAPFSGSGDLDGDGASNAEEYDRVVGNGETEELFLEIVFDPNRDGSEFRPGCAAGQTGQASDYLALGLLLGSLTVILWARARSSKRAVDEPRPPNV